MMTPVIPRIGAPDAKVGKVDEFNRDFIGPKRRPRIKGRYGFIIPMQTQPVRKKRRKKRAKSHEAPPRMYFALSKGKRVSPSDKGLVFDHGAPTRLPKEKDIVLYTASSDEKGEAVVTSWGIATEAMRRQLRIDKRQSRHARKVRKDARRRHHQHPERREPVTMVPIADSRDAKADNVSFTVVGRSRTGITPDPVQTHLHAEAEPRPEFDEADFIDAVGAGKRAKHAFVPKRDPRDYVASSYDESPRVMRTDDAELYPDTRYILPPPEFDMVTRDIPPHELEEPRGLYQSDDHVQDMTWDMAPPDAWVGQGDFHQAA